VPELPASGHAYQVRLEHYEGPLDLLLDLIRRQQINIHDIPIAQITSQYLEYLRRMEELNIELSADFLYMAATLIYIKSKMLLPAEPHAPDAPPPEDPRAELVRQLLEHEKFKSAAQMLYERQQLESHVWSRPDRSLYEGEPEEGELVVSLVDLVRVFQRVIERRREPPVLELPEEDITTEEMARQLRQALLATEALDLEEFFQNCPGRRAMVAAFLAVLELVRLGAVIVTQERPFDRIVLRKHRMFDIVLGQEPVQPAGREA
jgi:segregation and condensation protein A